MKEFFFSQLLLIVVDFKYVKLVPDEYCRSPLNTSDCGSPPTPVFSYYKYGSRCEIEYWRGCPTENKFKNEFHCSYFCIGKTKYYGRERAIINVQDETGLWHPPGALLDNGSEVHMVAHRLLKGKGHISNLHHDTNPQNADGVSDSWEGKIRISIEDMSLKELDELNKILHKIDDSSKDENDEREDTDETDTEDPKDVDVSSEYTKNVVTATQMPITEPILVYSGDIILRGN